MQTSGIRPGNHLLFSVCWEMTDNRPVFPIHKPAIRFDAAVNQPLIKPVDTFDHSLVRGIGILAENDPGAIT